MRTRISYYNITYSGDGRLGFSQYKNGMLMNKKNTFTDFIYIIEEYLFKHDITSKDKLAIWGRSAGGLLAGCFKYGTQCVIWQFWGSIYVTGINDEF